MSRLKQFKVCSLLSAMLMTIGAACDGDAEPKGMTMDSDAIDEIDAGSEQGPPLPAELTLPIVFIHGFAGSAQQYMSQAMRFVANGYPPDRIRAFDHDGAGFDIGGYADQADAFIDAVMAEFGVSQIYLVGHSRGTSVSNAYLENPARAAKVAKYIALDGRPCPTVVPCVAPNQAGLPGQTHVEVATSKESFAMQYEFLIGQPPAIVDIVPHAGAVQISGRAVDFPANTGRAGTTLQIFAINAETGMRESEEAHDTFEIGADGNWGPARLDPSKHYELLLSADGSTQQHFYPQSFPRSTNLVRLLSGSPDSPTRINTHVGDHHATVIALRMREWRQSDALEIVTVSKSGNESVPNVVTERLGDANIAVHLHDDAASPQTSTLGELPNLGGPFQTTADVYMPAADPPDGTITFKNLPRGDSTRPQILRVPNWSSTKHLISLMFSDYAQD
jgi:pimeloyl-ACP methyl ester carboxylesterase